MTRPPRPALRTARAAAPTFAGDSGRTRTTSTRAKLRGSLPERGNEVDVGVQPADLLVLLRQVDLQEVALGDHAHEAVLRHHRQGAAARLLHHPEAVLVGIGDPGHHQVPRPHVPPPRPLAIAPPGPPPPHNGAPRTTATH